MSPPILEPVAVYAHKAHPPGPGAHAAVAPDDLTYEYVSFAQEAPTTGAGGQLAQAAPMLSVDDFHSLGEIAVESDDGTQIIEIGWNIDPGVNFDLRPHLFAFHWVDGVGTCYNGCGFVQVSTTHMPGGVIEDGTTASFQIQHRGDGNWWLTYAGDDVGYYPDSLWTTTPYTQAGYVQWFGEVAANSDEPCTQMGNGVRGNNPTSASMTGLYEFSTAGAMAPAVVVKAAETLPRAYEAGLAVSDGFHFGGPGANPLSCTYQSEAVDGAVDAGVPAGGVDAGNAETGDGGGGCCDARGGDVASPLGLAFVVACVTRRRRAR